MRFSPALALTALSVAAVGQAGSAVDQIRAARLASNDALKRHDIQAFGASLDPELVVVTGGGTFVPSRQAYMDRLAKDFANPNSFRFERTPEAHLPKVLGCCGGQSARIDRFGPADGRGACGK